MKAACRKMAAWVLCALLALGIFLSAWFLVREIRHVCTGERCPVCAGLQAAAQRLRSGARPASPAGTAPAMRRAEPAAGKAVRALPGATLVEHKVRLDN